MNYKLQNKPTRKKYEFLFTVILFLRKFKLKLDLEIESNLSYLLSFRYTVKDCYIILFLFSTYKILNILFYFILFYCTLL